MPEQSTVRAAIRPDSSAAVPTAVIRPSDTATAPSSMTRRSSSRVTTEPPVSRRSQSITPAADDQNSTSVPLLYGVLPSPRARDVSWAVFGGGISSSSGRVEQWKCHIFHSLPPSPSSRL